MKKLIFTVITLLFTTLIYSQIKAVTENGDEVILYDNGKWEYINKPENETSEIFENKTKFLKDTTSTFLVKSNKINIGFWINPRVWSFSKDGDNEDSEYSFQKRDDDLYAIVICEKTSIPIESLRNIALENARNAAPDAKVLSEEYRNVNGIKILMMKMSATIQGIKIIYTGYYYSNANGTVQFLTYTSDNLALSYANEIEKFLNGLVEL